MDASGGKPRLLVIGGANLLQTGNHRIHHLVAILRQWGYALDMVGHVSYGEVSSRPSGASTGGAGHGSVRPSRVTPGGPMLRMEAEADDRLFVVRKPPGVMGRLAQDLLSYLLLCRDLGPHSVCLFGHPGNAVLAALLKRTGLVRRLIYDDWDYFPSHITTVRGRWDARELQWREGLCLRDADAVVSVSAVLANLRERQGARRVVVAANGVDGPCFGQAEARRVLPHPPTLIFMGSLYRAWGVDLAIRALPLIREALPEVRYLVSGAGPEESALRTLAHDDLRLGDGVRFLGRQQYKRLPEFLATADVGVVTYRDEEFVRYSSSLKALEYMAAGLPVIGTRVGETPRLVEESQAGVLVDFSPADFASAALHLFQDVEFYRRCRDNAVRCAAQHSWERTLGSMKELVREFSEEGV